MFVKNFGRGTILFGLVLYLGLLAVQILSGKAGHFFANAVPYRRIDPYDIFAGISIHHLVQMAIALVIIALLSKALKIDFYFQLGDVKKGVKYLVLFTSVFVVLSIALHTLMWLDNRLPEYAFPLDARNVLGTLGFQLFLSGPSEEILFRALPIGVLVYAFAGSIPVKGSLTLEVILASVLFSLAHAKWSLSPFTFQADYFQLFYAFVLGTVQGVVYQKSRSILYPILMHSFSNVSMVGVNYLFAAWAG